MSKNRKQKIQKLLALAKDAKDEESMSALAMAQKLMIENNISEEDIHDFKQQQSQELVRNIVIYSGRPRMWVYRLARIIAMNFRVKYYYQPGKTGDPTELRFVGLTSDIQIAEITFHYAKGSIAYCSKQFLLIPEVKRKRKRKWSLKRDYIEGYLNGLFQVFEQQVLANGYELALQLPKVVNEALVELNLTKGRDTSHKVKDFGAFYTGYKEGLNFKNRTLIDNQSS